jgi:hypothetical protein
MISIFMLYLVLMSNISVQMQRKRKEKEREQWRATAREAIVAKGLIIAPEKKPYKSFKEKERFFIQQCAYPDGTQVMVKISAPTLVEQIIVKKEAYWYQRIQELLKVARQKNINIRIRFPEVLDIATYKEHTGMVTRYIRDDWVGFKQLSLAEREDIIVTIIADMQKLPVPEEELALPATKRLIPIIMASDYPTRAKKYLGELVASGHLAKKESQTIIALMEEHVVTIASFPMKLDHGDFHSGNFRYYKDPHSGQVNLTLVDLELISIRPMLSMVAAAANFFDLASFANVHPERDRYPGILSDVPMFNTLFSAPQMIRRLEDAFVISKKNKNKAELVYRLLRIDDCYMRLADAVYEAKLFGEEVNKVEVESYKKILLEQLIFIKD